MPSDCRKSRFLARYCFELIALRPRHICLRSGSIWRKPSNHRLGFGAAPFSQKSSKIFGIPFVFRRARLGNVAISCQKQHEIGEKFHFCAAAVGNGGTGDGDQIKMKFFAKQVYRHAQTHLKWWVCQLSESKRCRLLCEREMKLQYYCRFCA